MTWDLVALLAQDGLVNGSIYALLAVALVLVFSVTRVIFIPQGEFVAYGGLTLAAIEAGRVPGTFALLCAGAAAVLLADGAAAVRARSARRLPVLLGSTVLYPAAVGAALRLCPFGRWPAWAQVPLALAIVVPLGPWLYRLAYQPIAGAPVLVLLIVSVALHLALVSLGLVAFGPEGSGTRAFSDQRLALGPLEVTVQSLLVIAFSASLIVGLHLFFERTLRGKALRASAMNRTGARLVGIPVRLTGSWSFGLAALVGALSGVLVAPVTTLYYDTGFLIGLKGFVGAIVGGLASYPLAAAGALLVGLVEAGASFAASAYKDLVVFALVVPVLLWRSLATRDLEDDT